MTKGMTTGFLVNGQLDKAAAIRSDAILLLPNHGDDEQLAAATQPPGAAQGKKHICTAVLCGAFGYFLAKLHLADIEETAQSRSWISR